MKKLFSTLIFTFCIWQVFSQSIKSEIIEYNFSNLPSTPLPSSVKNYWVIVEPTYIETNKKLLEEYNFEAKKAEDEFMAAMSQYNMDVKKADDEYTKAMDEYNKKGMGAKVVEKVLLNDNTKPTKRNVYMPVKRFVEKPFINSMYNVDALGSTYISIPTLENKNESPLKIVVQMHGYDFTKPKILSQQQSTVNYSSGNVYKGTRINYSAEYSYRHPMSIKAIMPNGKELFNHTPSQLNNYKIVTMNGYSNSEQLNTEVIVKNTEEKVLQENLQFVNNYINNKFGNEIVKRKVELFFVKNKNEAYTNLTVAFNNASTAFRMLVADSVSAKPQLEQSIATWNESIKQADFKDKDALINKDIFIALCFNLLEANYALKKIEDGYAVLQKLNAIDLSSKDRIKKSQVEAEYAELKKRIQKS